VLATNYGWRYAALAVAAVALSLRIERREPHGAPVVMPVVVPQV
jgi:hypothetical protein